MAQTPSGTIADTGCEHGEILVGIEEHPLNQGMRIKVHRRQTAKGARIEGSFDLLEAGRGTYAKYLAKHVGEPFLKASDLIDEIRASGADGEDCSHILNRNNLRRLPK
jgi:hypothetical protein